MILNSIKEKARHFLAGLFLFPGGLGADSLSCHKIPDVANNQQFNRALKDIARIEVNLESNSSGKSQLSFDEVEREDDKYGQIDYSKLSDATLRGIVVSLILCLSLTLYL